MKLSDWIQAIARWFMRFSVMNLIWFVMNLPFWFSLWSWYLSDHPFSIYHILLFILTFSVVFIPTTNVMFIVVKDWIQDISDDVGVVTYFKELKHGYKQYLKYGLVFSVVWMVWFIDLSYLERHSDILLIVFLTVGGFLFVFQVVFFCMQAYFHMPFKQMVTYTLVVVFGRPLLSGSILLINVMLLYIVLFQLPFLLPFFSGVVMAYLSFLIFNHWVNAIRLKVSQ